jgi:broad specificity polyphosphatase/5'/3'-nucleotidase SurE
VNFPAPVPDSPEVVVVPLRDIPFGDNFEPGVDPRGRSFFWPVRSFHGEVFGQGEKDPPESEGDYANLVERRVTITPLMHNITNTEALDGLPADARRFRLGGG